MAFSIVFLVILFAALAAIALTLLPAGADGHAPLPYLLALVPLLWVPLTAAAVVAAVLGRPVAVAFLVLVVLSFAHRWRYHWGMPPLGARTARAGSTRTGRATRNRETVRETPRETSRGTSPDGLTVMTLNCRFGRADASCIVREVRDRHVDVLALQELTAGLVSRLRAEGLEDALPHAVLGRERGDDNGGFNALWTSVRPLASDGDAVAIPAAQVPSVLVPVPGPVGDDGDRGQGDGPRPPRTLLVASAHPKSTMRSCRDWSAGIRGLGRLAAQATPGRDVAVLGDLNSSLEHPSFRALLRSGFHDSGADLRWLTDPGTYPRWLRWPRIVLDHVLLTPGVAARDIATVTVPGSDHLGLVATLGVS